MILFQTVLVILLFATPITDAQRCNRWNTCYKKVQQQENSTVKDTVMKINRTLSAKIEFLEQEKNKMNNTIQLLENMLYEQAKQINKLVEINSDSREIRQTTEEKISSLTTTTTTQIPTTQTQKSGGYRYEVVLFPMDVFWYSARKYCTDKGMDLIQHNPKLYTQQGRQELAATLNLPTSNEYHTGIKRDASNNQVWRRVSDGVAVDLDGWYPYGGYPDSRDGHDFLYWLVFNDSNSNTILNYPNSPRYFICEY